MNASAAGQKLVIVGASGMVGGYALRYALDHPVVERVTAIGRRKLGISPRRFREIDKAVAVEDGPVLVNVRITGDVELPVSWEIARALENTGE
jgi:hypothetical protein